MGQSSLIPSTISEPIDSIVRLCDLPADEELHSDPPTVEMIHSVTMLGVLQPVILITQRERYIVAAGRRRVKAARSAGLKQIPARIWPAGWASNDVLTLVENHHRSRNVASDYRAAQALVNAGYSPKDIGLHLGIAQGRLNALLRMNGLIPDLKRAFLDGEICAGHAAALARKHADIQVKAWAIFHRSGKLTTSDIQHAAQRHKQEIVAALPDVLFEAVAQTAAPSLSAMVQVEGQSAQIEFTGKDGRWTGEVNIHDLFVLLYNKGMIVKEEARHEE